MKVLLTSASLEPRYGGPAFSISGLANALAKTGLDVGLWAADQTSATSVLAVDSLVTRLRGTEVQALDSFGRVDVLHDSGLWLRHNHRLAKLAMQRCIPRVVSPRGMLEPWAMGHKRWKKAVAWRLYQRRDLGCVSCLHTTADQETQSVQALRLAVPIFMVPNGVDLPKTDRTTHRRSERPKAALFLGRLHPKKGLALLIEAWAKLQPDGWILRIAGPDEAEHRTRLEKAVTAAHLNHKISFIGFLDEQKKKTAFSEADLFVLPTLSENFGTVVAEALAHGVPVLTTTGAPWSLLPESGCGWWVRPTVDGLIEGLTEATSCDDATLASMGARGKEIAATRFAWAQVAQKISSMYDMVLTGR